MSKRALIIGGSSGIGLATVAKLISHDYDLVIIHRDRRQQQAELEQKLDSLITNGQKVSRFNVDATNEDRIRECLDEVVSISGSHFHLVLHAVSRGNLKPFVGDTHQLTAQDLQLTIDAMGTNLHHWVAELLKRELLVEKSRIIALTSEGNERVWAGYGAVAIAKSALETMCKYLAVELAPKGIRVNVLQAGVTDTPSLRMIPGVDQLITSTQQRNPLGRLTMPEDVANMVYLLTLPEADWVNGSLIHVDGGEHLI